MFRWLTAFWAAGIFFYEIYDRQQLTPLKPDVANPLAGTVMMMVLLVFMLALTWLYNREAELTLNPFVIFAEIGLATLMFLLDVWVYGNPDHSQALPTVWPIGIIATVAIAAGQRPAVLTGLGFGVARYVGWVPYNETAWSLTRTSSLVLMMIAGWVAGYFLHRLEEADREISGFRAREEVGRTLHDGVLQTLAVIQRRSEDTELVTLARTQELELREYLFGGSAVEADIGSGLRAAGRRAEQRYGIKVQVVCAPDLAHGEAPKIHALSAAVGEALTNAVKHGGATEATVYAEPDMDDESQTFVSVKDNGSGFDTNKVKQGQGLTRSIKGRILEVGGRVEVSGRPGRGAEIRMWA